MKGCDCLGESFVTQFIRTDNSSNIRITLLSRAVSFLLPILRSFLFLSSLEYSDDPNLAYLAKRAQHGFRRSQTAAMDSPASPT